MYYMYNMYNMYNNYKGYDFDMIKGYDNDLEFFECEDIIYII